ncbi:MAG: hypothetical protein A2452_10730 [Candidatus Firestonebacteria bacterium RIFOXYC2_FULL_39_67]|nr:MAG: hypothetical protein A2536_01235 [Candidatus Firestonebacteria bacterium RIFOXYD2_FULL_39_29]OGF54167.1 MAG: hypothetical protein A2452_10730 [Candidatus Firestonebacteria bacterium RIFOXYC2_FULL_39_67]OGF57198.1 MAG: hypothetical protein A2497_05100 [Candidatus Firestonebacteria bacterium RifOxyC12_full_39_7]
MVDIDELIEQRKKDPVWELKIARGVFAAKKRIYKKKRIITATLFSLLLIAGSGVFFAANRKESLKNNLDSVISETLPHYTAGVIISGDIDSKIDLYCMAVGE